MYVFMIVLFVSIIVLTYLLFLKNRNTKIVNYKNKVKKEEILEKEIGREKDNKNKSYNFIIYYEALDDIVIEKLSKYDVVIIEPRNSSKDEIIKLKKFGVKVYGYTSIVEQNENNSEFRIIQDICFYRPEGKKMKSHKWQSFYMDIRIKEYQLFLKNQVKKHIIDKELDGVFFDTVGDIEDLEWNEYDKLLMKRSYVEFLRDLKSNFEDLYIIQNWGLQIAKEYSSRLIDGLMWESFSFELLKTDQWSLERYKEINNMNVDFYIVSPKEEDIKLLKNKKTYVYTHENDIYSSI